MLDNCGIFTVAVKGKELTMTPEDRKAAAELLEKHRAVESPLDDDEPTSEELVEMLRQALHEANTGQTRPASEIMRELREMLAADADAS